MSSAVDEGIAVLVGMSIGESAIWDGLQGEIIRVTREGDTDDPSWYTEAVDVSTEEVLSTRSFTDPDEVLDYVWNP